MQGISSHLISCHLFHNFPESTDLIRPCFDVLFPLHLRKIHDMNRHILRQDLPCFLLTVTGCLSDIHIRDPEKRTGPVKSRPNRRLDQRAGIGWKYFLTTWNPELRTAAKSRCDSIRRKYNFIRNIHTESSKNLSTFFLMLYQLCRTDSMNFRYNKIIVIHSLRSVLLRKVYIAKRLRKHFTELVMCLYIHPKLFPHFVIICHFFFPPLSRKKDTAA